MLQQCWLTLQATDFPQQTNGWTVWHEKCLLNAGRHTPPPPPGLNVMVAFLSVASATKTHKNCRMCLWPQLLSFVLWCTTRKDDSFLSAWCLQSCVIACMLQGSSLEFSWLGRPFIFYTAHSSSWGCHKLQKLSREDESQCHKTCLAWVLAVKCVSSVPSAYVEKAFMTTKRRAHAPETLDI